MSVWAEVVRWQSENPWSEDLALRRTEDVDNLADQLLVRAVGVSRDSEEADTLLRVLTRGDTVEGLAALLPAHHRDVVIAELEKHGAWLASTRLVASWVVEDVQDVYALLPASLRWRVPRVENGYLPRYEDGVFWFHMGRNASCSFELGVNADGVLFSRVGEEYLTDEQLESDELDPTPDWRFEVRPISAAEAERGYWGYN